MIQSVILHVLENDLLLHSFLFIHTNGLNLPRFIEVPVPGR